MWYLLIGIVLLLGVLGALVYWQLWVAEGAYLGRRMVTLLYDLFAKRYDRVKQFDPASDTVALAEPILTHLHRTAGGGRLTTRSASSVTGHLSSIVLDVATGTGRLPQALFMQSAFTGCIVAIDASRQMLALAQQKLHAYQDRIEWRCADAEKLDFSDEAFDVVTCLEAIEFFQHPDQALREMLRVLKPAGLLVISNRIGPDVWMLPGRATSTAAFAAKLEKMGLEGVDAQDWLVDYDLVVGVKAVKS